MDIHVNITRKSTIKILFLLYLNKYNILYNNSNKLALIIITL